MRYTASVVVCGFLAAAAAGATVVPTSPRPEESAQVSLVPPKLGMSVVLRTDNLGGEFFNRDTAHPRYHYCHRQVDNDRCSGGVEKHFQAAGWELSVDSGAPSNCSTARHDGAMALLMAESPVGVLNPREQQTSAVSPTPAAVGEAADAVTAPWLSLFAVADATGIVPADKVDKFLKRIEQHTLDVFSSYNYVVTRLFSQREERLRWNALRLFGDFAWNALRDDGTVDGGGEVTLSAAIVDTRRNLMAVLGAGNTHIWEVANGTLRRLRPSDTLAAGTNMASRLHRVDRWFHPTAASGSASGSVPVAVSDATKRYDAETGCLTFIWDNVEDYIRAMQDQVDEGGQTTSAITSAVTSAAAVGAPPASTSAEVKSPEKSPEKSTGFLQLRADDGDSSATGVSPTASPTASATASSDDDKQPLLRPAVWPDEFNFTALQFERSDGSDATTVIMPYPTKMMGSIPPGATPEHVEYQICIHPLSPPPGQSQQQLLNFTFIDSMTKSTSDTGFALRPQMVPGLPFPLGDDDLRFLSFPEGRDIIETTPGSEILLATDGLLRPLELKLAGALYETRITSCVEGETNESCLPDFDQLLVDYSRQSEVIYPPFWKAWKRFHAELSAAVDKRLYELLQQVKSEAASATEIAALLRQAVQEGPGADHASVLYARLPFAAEESATSSSQVPIKPHRAV